MQRSDHRRAVPRRYLLIAQELLMAITTGAYAPGERLPGDREVAARSKVSRPTAREAFLALELIGAVEVRHGGGTYVRGPQARVGGVDGSPLDAPPRELIETRRVLEPAVAGLAARRATVETLAMLRRNIDEAAELVTEVAQLPRFISLGLSFHADLATGCGNNMLADIVGQLVEVEAHPLWVLVNQQAMGTIEARQSQVTEHRGALVAITDRDAQRAEQAMHSHLTALGAAIFSVQQVAEPADR